MPWDTPLPVLIWALTGLPLSLWALLKPPAGKLPAYLIALDILLLNLYFAYTAPWAVVNYYLRALPFLLSLAVIARMIHAARSQPFFPQTKQGWALTAILLVLAVPPAFMDAQALRSYRYPASAGPSMYALPPLQGGLHVFINGGNGLDGWGMNNAYRDWLGRQTGADPAAGYSVDLVKLAASGAMSRGILPRDFRRYEIFGERVYSPCLGQVVKVQDGIADVPPFSDSGSALGNYVVLKCAQFSVTLANLRVHSISVKEGELVALNTPLAEVGNSMAHTFPHLHMRAATGGESGTAQPAPILFETLFDFAYRARNDFYVR